MTSFEHLKKDFPQLKDGEHFLDTAASSLTPRQVVDAMNEYYFNYRANVHRGFYASGVKATQAYEDARVKVAKFIGANDPSEIIFTSGATESANMLMRMFEESHALAEGDEVVTTVMEHHSALVPLQQLAKRQHLTLKYIPLNGSRLNMVKAEELITKKTKFVSVMLASNVLGTINDVVEIARLARAAGGMTVVDASAAVGHMMVDVKALGVDALYFSGHKMLGPTGIGVLWVKKSLADCMAPGVWGGGMIARVSEEGATWADVPERFEPGTKNIAGAIGLGAAIDYIDAAGGPLIIAEHVCQLTRDAITKLEEIEGVHVLAEHDVDENIGIVAFSIDGIHAHDVAQVLAEKNIAVRSGHQCAMPLHESLSEVSTTRASFYLYNTTEDTDALIEAVKYAQRLFSTPSSQLPTP